jgi:hypothetical protein
MVKKYVSVEGDNNLVRDEITNAVLSVDNKGLSEYRRIRLLNRQKAQTFENITKDIDSLKNDITEIKQLLINFGKMTRD